MIYSISIYIYLYIWSLNSPRSCVKRDRSLANLASSWDPSWSHRWQQIGSVNEHSRRGFPCSRCEALCHVYVYLLSLWFMYVFFFLLLLLLLLLLLSSSFCIIISTYCFVIITVELWQSRRTRSGWTKCAREHELCVWRLKESPPTLAVSNLRGPTKITQKWIALTGNDSWILMLLIWRDTNIQYYLDFNHVLFKITSPSAWYKKDVNWNLFQLNMVSSSPRCARPNRFASDMQLVMDSALIVSCRLIMQDYKISDSNAKLSTSIDYLDYRL